MNESQARQEDARPLLRFPLPPPRTTGGPALSEALASRASLRRFLASPVSREDLAQILWATDGVIPGTGRRAAPSAGGTYPLEVRAVLGDVPGLPPGIHRYLPGEHSIEQESEGDRRTELMAATVGQADLAVAPVIVVISAVPDRTTARYGPRGIPYVLLEAGHAAQNLCLQVTALGLGTVPIGAFRDDALRRVLSLHPDEQPLYLLPVGLPLLS